MSNWAILQFEFSREIPVTRNMNRLGITYFNPIEVREIKASRNAPRVKSILREYSLIPGKMFIRGGPAEAHKAISTQYVEKVLTDAFENIIAIPEFQVLRFQSTILEYNEEIRKAWQNNQQIAAPKLQKKYKSLREAFQELSKQEEKA